MAGQLRVDEITDEAGTGSPSFPNGVAASTATSITGTTTAAIPDGALASGTADATTFLRGDRTWEVIDAATPGQLEVLNTQTFTASGTWTKPTGFDPDDTVMVMCIGGGGGGAASNNTVFDLDLQGGAGGAVGFLAIRYADAPSSVPCTIAAGGAGGVQSSPSTEGTGGTNAGFTIFGASVNNFFIKCNGAGGPYPSNLAVQSIVEYRVLSKTTTSYVGTSDSGVSLLRPNLEDRGYSQGRVIDTSTVVPNSFIGLTGGGGGISNTSATFNTAAAEGHKGTVLGEGGNAVSNANGQNGGIPGGGGGASRRRDGGQAVGGTGGRGEIRVFILRGRVSPAQFKTFSV
jgi:hypothetical protein